MGPRRSAMMRRVFSGSAGCQAARRGLDEHLLHVMPQGLQPAERGHQGLALRTRRGGEPDDRM
jgi:hypothetical protein